MCGSKKNHLARFYRNLFGAGVLGDCLRPFAHCMLCEFTREKKTYGSLDFARWNSPPLVLVGKSGSFSGQSLEDVVDEGVHDAHRLGRHSNIGMNLLKYSVDVYTIGLLPGLLSFHDLFPFSTFAAFLRGTFLWALSWRWLTTSTHNYNFQQNDRLCSTW